MSDAVRVMGPYTRDVLRGGGLVRGGTSGSWVGAREVWIVGVYDDMGHNRGTQETALPSLEFAQRAARLLGDRLGLRVQLD